LECSIPCCMGKRDSKKKRKWDLTRGQKKITGHAELLRAAWCWGADMVGLLGRGNRFQKGEVSGKERKWQRSYGRGGFGRSEEPPLILLEHSQEKSSSKEGVGGKLIGEGAKESQFPHESGHGREEEGAINLKLTKEEAAWKRLLEELRKD